MDYTSITKTKQGFEDSFASDAFYNKQTQDEKHLEQILTFPQIHKNMRILDLGTGTGYLAFAFAKKYPTIEISGLDIVDKTLERNREKAKQEHVSNIEFVSYDGVDFPFAAESFDLVVTRYALHHFPAIEETFREVNRVLKPGGEFFVIDPAPNEDDKERFVDAYMQMKKDGHIRYYTKQEWVALGEKAGFVYKDSFDSKIRFPRKKDTALEFADIMEQYDDKVIEGYQVDVIGDEIWITEKVNNVVLGKKG